jgi:hypothetical protein
MLVGTRQLFKSRVEHFKRRLKTLNESAALKESGRLFQTVGAAT